MLNPNQYKKVDKKTFSCFVKNWPNKLEWDCLCTCEPPLGSYNDFTTGKVWPESIVAKIRLHNNIQQREYYILSE